MDAATLLLVLALKAHSVKKEEGCKVQVFDENIMAAQTIYQEAAGEAFDGKVNVGLTILERVALGHRPVPKVGGYIGDGSVTGVVLWPYQFSGWNSSSPERVRCLKIDDSDPAWAQSKAAWEVAKAKYAHGLSHGALFYYNPAVPAPAPPVWLHLCDLVMTEGHHQFYKPKS